MSKGITLIETLIGLAILSFGIIAIIAVFPLGVKSLDMNYRTNTALFLASSQIENVIDQDYENLDLGVATENFGEIEDFTNYKRETHIDCFDPENEECSEETGMKEVEVTVYSKRGNDETKLKTLIINK
ncbi:MAG: type IV pilus modification PilV family protein [Patescibacteria group bacterium]